MNDKNTNPKYEPSRLTARDLLFKLGGEQHAMHSVIAKSKSFMGTFKITCVCGEVFEVGASEENVDAVRNVQLVVKKAEGK